MSDAEGDIYASQKTCPGPAAGSAGLAPLPGDPGTAQMLRSVEFRKNREHSWRKLDNLLARIEKHGISVLSAEEAQALPLLYRAASSSLSVARSIVLDRNLLLYLENLSLRAYLAVYGPRSGILERLAEFFRRGFPSGVRAMRGCLPLAFCALLIGIISGWALASSDMSYFTMLVPEALAQGRGPGSSTDDLRRTLFGAWPGFVQSFVVFANSLFRHNAIVGIMSFGLSFALGIPTLLLVIYNGLVLGAFIALYEDHGLAADFAGWLGVHGVTELLAVLLCAAAGFGVAGKILFPGSLPRLDGLALYGRQAAAVVAGAVLLFFIAGFLEGGFRQLIDNTPGRYIFALASGALWLAYFTRCGKAGKYGRAG